MLHYVNQSQLCEMILNLLIEIVENPIIQRINIKGVKNKAIFRELETITKKSEKRNKSGHSNYVYFYGF